jgi:glutamate-1-semialdehyde 2,1-aminomutase
VSDALRFPESERLLARAKRVIPGGIYGHTAPHLLVPGKYPYFFARARGSRLWDVDGNEYVDLLCSYGPIVLGHNHPKVDEAAARRAAEGRLFDGPGREWVELAERLVDLVPWADWAVFAKNGADVCTWALHVARAATGRQTVLAVTGAYHGTHPWCTPTRDGLTTGDRAHVTWFRWNDLAGLDDAIATHDGDVAAIMVTPFRHEVHADQEMPAPDFLPGVRERCDRLGAVMILDDVRAGFRLHPRGSGEAFGVQPDFACFSKAIANGHALSAAVARESLRDAARRVFFTGTYWISPVEMAAALACLAELDASDAVAVMRERGERLRDGLLGQAATHDMAVRHTGPPAIPFLTFDADAGSFERSRIFAAACVARGVYVHPYHNWFVSTALTDADLDRVLEATDAAFRDVAAACRDADV